MSKVTVQVKVLETKARVVSHEVDLEEYLDWNGQDGTWTPSDVEEFILSHKDPRAQLGIDVDAIDWEIDFVDVSQNV